MADTPELTITNRTLARLSKIAEGNGIDLKKIELIESHEDIYVLEGQIRLKPHISIGTRQYAGPVKGKGKKVLPTFQALQEEAKNLSESRKNSKDWLEDALKELKESPGHGWGFEKAKITLPENVKTVAANEKCPACQGAKKTTCSQCQGRAVIICPQCEGRGQEQCYHCYMQGYEPSNPQQVCSICRGTKWAECRLCQRRMQLPCPACQGRGGTACAQCKGAGSFTQEISVETSTEIHFDVLPNRNLPSSLLRSIDRLGMVNLSKGHADIEMAEPDKNAPANEQNLAKLAAKIPFAEIKARINNRPVRFCVFGKKALFVETPSFLDESLRPWREHLVRAAMGSETLDKALEARAMREALGLELAGKHDPSNLRQLYPVGLSAATAKEIMNNLGLALKRLTIRSRLAVSAVSITTSAGLFAGLFLSSLRQNLAAILPPTALTLTEALLPVLVVGLSYIGLLHTSRWALKRRFPNAEIRLNQKIGKIGYGTLAGIFVLYAVIFALAEYQ